MSEVLDTAIESLDATGQSAESNAPVTGFLVVSIEANRQNRYVEAVFEIGGQQVGRLTAADNHLDGVISSQAQITSIPIPAGARWRVSWNVPNNNNEVRLWFVRQ